MKSIFLFFLFFAAALGVSAQNVLWETYTNGGKQAYARGDYAEAERLFKAALREAENLKAPELIAESNGNLGAFYQTQEKYDEAEKLFLKAIETWEQVGYKDSNEITYALSNLGLLYAEQKKYEKAEALLRRALTIRERVQSPDLAVALLNLGKVYAEQDKVTEAQAVYEKAFELFVFAEDKNIEGILNTANNLSLIYEKQNNDKKLEAILHIIIDMTEKYYGKDDASLIPYLEKYATLLRKQKRNTEAIQVEARVKRLRQLNK